VSYLPPPGRDGLVKETGQLIVSCLVGIALLGIVVYFLTV
jgi:hypothetical protein